MHAHTIEPQVPQALLAAMEAQRTSCEAVLSSKDEAIAQLTAALQAKDDEYVRLLKRQAQEVDKLLAVLASQVLGSRGLGAPPRGGGEGQLCSGSSKLGVVPAPS
jgi:hypothetical protein